MVSASAGWSQTISRGVSYGTTQAAQQTVKSQHPYQCFYRTARLLYSATYIPNPTPTTTTPAKRR